MRRWQAALNRRDGCPDEPGAVRPVLTPLPVHPATPGVEENAMSPRSFDVVAALVALLLSDIAPSVMARIRTDPRACRNPGFAASITVAA